MASGITALWEPDVHPPDAWLIPSVLYQDRISTFAPVPSPGNADAAAAQRLGQILGPLYQPLYLWQAVGSEDALPLLEEIRACMPRWRMQVAALHRRTQEPLLSRWLERTQPGLAAPAGPQAELHQAVRRSHHVEQNVERLRAEAAEADLEAGRLEAEVERLRIALAPQLAEERERRKAPYAEALARRAALVESPGRWGSDPAKDAAIRDLDDELKAISRRLGRQPPPTALVPLVAAKQAAELTARWRHDAAAALDDGYRASAAASERVAVLRRGVEQPWLTSKDDAWARQGVASGLWPKGLQSLAAAKLYGSVWDVLVRDCGFWLHAAEGVRRDGWGDRRRYKHSTLIGPEVIIDDVLSLLASWYCSQRSTWVQMSTLGRPRPGMQTDAETADQFVALAIGAALPCPLGVSLQAALEFRLAHEEELAAVRAALAAELPPVGNLADVEEAVQALRLAVAEPLAQVDRALALEGSWSIRSTLQAVVHKGHRGFLNQVRGSTAAGLATPLFGNTLDLASAGAASVGGAGLVVGGLTWHAIRQKRMAAKELAQVGSSPYLYLYDMERTSGHGPS